MMIGTLKQILQATSVSQRLGEKLMARLSEERWKQQLASYLQYEQKQYELWQYIYFLIVGRYGEKSVDDAVMDGSVNDLVNAALGNEIKKAMLCYELRAALSGAPQQAADRALERALEYGNLFVMMMQTRLTDQIQR
ncbi:hypothetical protein [Thermaerobacillus caldiproteolyticus]|uniref:hypothetical protein n=1 Tax=Thermaerobacillus caldiproteolyticus TaxID=247480 RepID=UPI0018F11036|nr:hypothetical protein [Anoxybacillus caldiproteolyticus]